MPAVLALFGSLIVVVVTARMNTKAVSAQIETVRAELRGEMQSLRAEVRQLIAELELRIVKEILELRNRVERLEEQRGIIRQP